MDTEGLAITVVCMSVFQYKCAYKKRGRRFSRPVEIKLHGHFATTSKDSRRSYLPQNYGAKLFPNFLAMFQGNGTYLESEEVDKSA